MKIGVKFLQAAWVIISIILLGIGLYVFFKMPDRIDDYKNLAIYFIGTILPMVAVSFFGEGWQKWIDWSVSPDEPPADGAK